MKSELKAKLLQHFAGKKKANGGFTLIELLVVIIIIGILSAIALPSFLNQANKARASEAKAYVGSMNRGQQAYYMENGNFAYDGADDIDSEELAFSALGLGITQTTENYIYKIAGEDASDTQSVVVGQAQPSDGEDEPAIDEGAAVKAYVGAVKVGVTTEGGDATTLAILCEGIQPPIAEGVTGEATAEDFGNTEAAEAGAPECGEGYKTIK
jgi:type IV pilus assembly protein PilA